MITSTDIEKYNALRPVQARDKVCHAPSVSLNFEQNGNVTACCFNRTDVLGRYPDQTISEIWNGLAIHQLRKNIAQKKLDGGCKLCGILLESGNYQGTKAIHYDEYAIPQGKMEKLKSFVGLKDKSTMPRVFEFEISNTCNLECEMCNGYFSSTIRKNREQLPPMHNPYDDAFVDQVAEFMPYLTDLKFLGGEPFLIEIYYKIWERVAVVNPNIRIHITTNGTVFNNRVKEIMTRLNVGLVISVDSIDPEEFASVRSGAKLSRVLENLEQLHALTKKKNTYLTIAACAMSTNWKGIPKLIEFCNAKEIPIHFNVVWNPGHLSMRYMNFDELTQIAEYFASVSLPNKTNTEKMNVKAFAELNNTVKHWKSERAKNRLEKLDSYENVDLVNPSLLSEIPSNSPDVLLLAKSLVKHYAWAKPAIKDQLITVGFLDSDEPKPIKPLLFNLWKKNGDSWFFEAYFKLMPLLAGAFYGVELLNETETKAAAILAHVTDMRRQQAILSDLIDDIDRKSVVNHLQLITNNTTENLLAHVEENY